MQPTIHVNEAEQEKLQPDQMGTLISNTARDLREITSQLKSKGKDLKTRLELNPTYEAVNEEYKGVAKTKKDVKLKVIAASEDMKKLDTELRSLKIEKKELENALSDYLIEFESKTGQLSFLDDDGNTIEFEKIAKLRLKAQ